MNTQPIEKPVEGTTHLSVVDIWDTIQGEGPFAGMPSVFVRLAGCNLQCPACDTDYTTGRKHIEVEALIRDIRALAGRSDIQHPRKLVVITGGEPFRQDIRPLVHGLLPRGFKVQIETNGTLYPAGLRSEAFIVCSPKTPGINPAIGRRAKAWKYVVEEGKIDPRDGLPTSALGMPRPPARPPMGVKPEDIYVSPMDAQDADRNKVNTEAAVESCLKFGYRLSLQTHKLVGLA